MTLAAWQSALANLVIDSAAGRCPPATDSVPVDDLSAPERAWLESLCASPGFKITCDVQRWWREFRVQLAAPLTLAALDGDLRGSLVAEYIRRNSRPSSFFLREALPFLDLCLEQAHAVPHVAALARFERAMLRLGEALSSGSRTLIPADATASQPLEAHPLAEVVAFSAPPAQVLAAAARRLPLPDPTHTQHWLLLAPGLPNLARPSTPEEAHVLQLARTTPIATTAAGAQALYAAGALRACQP